MTAPPLPLLVFFPLAVFGAAWGIGYSTLTLPVRQRLAAISGEEGFLGLLLSLIECLPCLSFHLGWLGGWLLLRQSFWGSAGIAFYCTAVSFVLGRITALIKP